MIPGCLPTADAHSAVLAAGNAIGLSLCAGALALVVRYRSRAAHQEPVATPPALAVNALLDAPEALDELHTTELDALRMVVVDAHAARKRHGDPVHAG